MGEVVHTSRIKIARKKSPSEANTLGVNHETLVCV
jgi:hypothetical protein